MTHPDRPLPPALRRALDLLADPPDKPDVDNGYLDLLAVGSAQDTAVAQNTGPVQAVWASTFGSLFYDNAQAVGRRLLTAWQHPTAWLNLAPGGIALDVGCGPGSITGSLGQAVGPDGLALGVNISEPMLARAVRNAVGPQTGFLRADAQRLPLRDETVNAVVSVAALQLVPDPKLALAEMRRVLRPGGRLAVMVPTAGRARRLWRLLPRFGARGFDDDELGDLLEDLGFTAVRVKSVGTIQWVRGQRG